MGACRALHMRVTNNQFKPLSTLWHPGISPAALRYESMGGTPTHTRGNINYAKTGPNTCSSGHIDRKRVTKPI